MYFLPSSILKWLHKNSPIFDVFFEIQADMTVVTIQRNKIVLKEVKDNSALLEPSYAKTQIFGQPNIIATEKTSMSNCWL